MGWTTWRLRQLVPPECCIWQPNYVHCIPGHHFNIHCYHNLIFEVGLKGLIKYTSWHPKMEVAGSSVMLIHIEQTAGYHISEDYNVNPIYTHIWSSMYARQISGLLFSFFIFVFHIKHWIHFEDMNFYSCSKDASWGGRTPPPAATEWQNSKTWYMESTVKVVISSTSRAKRLWI